MSRIVSFTYSVNRYTMDLTEILQDPEDSQHTDALKLVDLLHKRDYERTKNKVELLESQIFEMLNMSLDVELDPAKLFSIDSLSIPLNNENSSLSIAYDDNGYVISGDIWFELTAKRNITYAVMEKWEENGGEIHLPAFNCALGEYACDSGSDVSWEIEEE
jgi:hypothetical protein